MRIDIFDVGHGACSVVNCPNGARVMIDCGFRLDPSWFPSITFGGQRFDLLLLSNLDEDHVQDLKYVGQKVRLGAIFSNPSVHAAALATMKHEHGMAEGVRYAHAILSRFGPGLIGSQPNFGDVYVRPYCNRYAIDFWDTNNLSVATFFRWRGFTIMFAGDLETRGWQTLLRNPAFASDLATVNVLVASHHGRVNGCSDDVFKIVRPDVVVFSDDQKQYESQDTDAWYRARVKGIPDLGSTPDPLFGLKNRHVLTTRRDGTLTLQVNPDGRYIVTPTRVQSPTRAFGTLARLGLSAA